MSQSSLARVKVVYVMGAGHSGSTILGVALGNCSGFFYAGEVEEWLAVSGKPALGGSERIEFWGAVREVMDKTPARDAFGFEVNRYVERSSAILRVDRWGERRKMLHRYRAIALDLFRAIVRTSGATHIVDTSHFPLRARELQKLSDIDLYLVMLVRDPQDVVSSHLRGIRRRDVAARRVRTVTTNAGLWITHLLSAFVFVRHPRDRRIFVRHEDFVDDPHGVLRQIIDRIDPTLEVPDVNALRTGQPLQGNRLINAQTIAVERPRRRRGKRSYLTQALQAPWGPVLSRLTPAAHAGDSRPPSAGQSSS